MLLVLCVIGTRGWAQIDEKKMDRDLEVARNVLATLMSDNNDMFFMNRNIDASYLPGYGVTFSLPENPFMFMPMIKAQRMMEGAQRKMEYRYQIEQSDSEGHEGSTVLVNPDNENEEGDKENSEQEKSWEDQQNHLKSAVTTFFSDYADLIGQLGPESRIRVVEKASPDFNVFVWTSGDNQGEKENRATGFTAEVYKKDITAYKEGKISLDDFTKKISFEDKSEGKLTADLDLFSKILKSYFGPEVSQSYFVENNPTYERIDNYGVIYSVRTYSSYQDNDLFKMPTTGQKDLNQEERNKKAEELYPAFKTDIKNFILDYGRTIRSLGSDESLILKISLTRCDECSMPKSLEVSVKASVLSQYDQQKITKDKALAAIEVKENNQ